MEYAGSDRDTAQLGSVGATTTGSALDIMGSFVGAHEPMNVNPGNAEGEGFDFFFLKHAIGACNASGVLMCPSF